VGVRILSPVRVRAGIGWILRAGGIRLDIVASGVSEGLDFMVDWVSPWLVRDLGLIVLWGDGCFWGSSLWDTDIVEVGEVEDDISERVQVF